MGHPAVVELQPAPPCMPSPELLSMPVRTKPRVQELRSHLQQLICSLQAQQAQLSIAIRRQSRAHHEPHMGVGTYTALECNAYNQMAQQLHNRIRLAEQTVVNRNTIIEQLANLLIEAECIWQRGSVMHQSCPVTCGPASSNVLLGSHIRATLRAVTSLITWSTTTDGARLGTVECCLAQLQQLLADLDNSRHPQIERAPSIVKEPSCALNSPLDLLSAEQQVVAYKTMVKELLEQLNQARTEVLRKEESHTPTGVASFEHFSHTDNCSTSSSLTRDSCVTGCGKDQQRSWNRGIGDITPTLPSVRCWYSPPPHHTATRPSPRSRYSSPGQLDGKGGVPPLHTTPVDSGSDVTLVMDSPASVRHLLVKGSPEGKGNPCAISSEFSIACPGSARCFFEQQPSSRSPEQSLEQVATLSNEVPRLQGEVTKNFAEQHPSLRSPVRTPTLTRPAPNSVGGASSASSDISLVVTSLDSAISLVSSSNAHEDAEQRCGPTPQTADWLSTLWCRSMTRLRPDAKPLGGEHSQRRVSTYQSAACRPVLVTRAIQPGASACVDVKPRAGFCWAACNPGCMGQGVHVVEVEESLGWGNPLWEEGDSRP